MSGGSTVPQAAGSGTGGSEATRAAKWSLVKRLRRAVPQWVADLVWPSLEPLTPDDEDRELKKERDRLSQQLARVDAIASRPPARAIRRGE